MKHPKALALTIAASCAIGLGIRHHDTIEMFKDMREIFVTDKGHPVVQNLADNVYEYDVKKSHGEDLSWPGRDVSIFLNDARDATNSGRNINTELVLMRGYDATGTGLDSDEVQVVIFQQGIVPHGEAVDHEDITTTIFADSMIVEKTRHSRLDDTSTRVSISRTASTHNPMDAPKVQNLYVKGPR